jgi:tRNA modification GTPase
VVHPRLPVLATVLTKVDLVPELPATLERSLPAAPRFLVSNHTGQGLEQLRRFLLQRVGGGPSGRGNRVRDILARSRLRLADAVTATASGEPVEIVAVELGEVLRLLDEVHGRSTPEDLLDRIFSRFCLGK